MEENGTKENKKSFSIDWLISGVLTKIGDMFDRLTGRGYKPSSSLATSELIERLKYLLDSEVKNFDEKGSFVPHNLKLKMQWDKFSTDSEEAIKALENELKIATIDHINDKRYHTYAPINIEIKPDYFTEGVKILASFDKFDDENKEVVVNLTVPDLKIEGLSSPDEPVYKEEIKGEVFSLNYNLNGKQKITEFTFEPGERKSIGRTKENELVLNDTSVSKIHAALVLNSQNQLMLADTGSTNGTFINGRRIAYGRAFNVNDGDTLGFGTVEVELKHLNNEAEIVEDENSNIVSEIPQIENDNLSEIFGSSEIKKDSMDFESELEDELMPDPIDEDLSQVQPRKYNLEKTEAELDFDEIKNDDEPEDKDR